MLLTEFQEKFKQTNREKDKGIINSKSGASMLIDEDGNINISASALSQIKINKENNSKNEVFNQTNSIVNRKSSVIDELLLNYHKLNNLILELSDFKELLDGKANMGMLNMGGTVLVKTWDLELNKYVLTRRNIRTPLFSKALDFATTVDQMDINNDDKVEKKESEEKKESKEEKK